MNEGREGLRSSRRFPWFGRWHDILFPNCMPFVHFPSRPCRDSKRFYHLANMPYPGSMRFSHSGGKLSQDSMQFSHSGDMQFQDSTLSDRLRGN